MKQLLSNRQKFDQVRQLLQMKIDHCLTYDSLQSKGIPFKYH